MDRPNSPNFFKPALKIISPALALTLGLAACNGNNNESGSSDSSKPRVENNQTPNSRPFQQDFLPDGSRIITFIDADGTQVTIKQSCNDSPNLSTETTSASANQNASSRRLEVEEGAPVCSDGRLDSSDFKPTNIG